MAIAAPKSYDTLLDELLGNVGKGKLQLPEFQRDWTWDDVRIRNIIASLSKAYPMGAIMCLDCGGDEIRFRYRTFEGVKDPVSGAESLVLDGQQRLTSLYCSLFFQGARQNQERAQAACQTVLLPRHSQMPQSGGGSSRCHCLCPGNETDNGELRS